MARATVERNYGRPAEPVRLALTGAVLALTWIGIESTCEPGEKSEGKSSPTVNYTELARSGMSNLAKSEAAVK